MRRKLIPPLALVITVAVQLTASGGVRAAAERVERVVLGGGTAAGASSVVRGSRVLLRRTGSGRIFAAAASAVIGAETVGISYDDGEADTFYQPEPGTFLDLVMRFDLPRNGLAVQQLSACLASGGTDTTLDLDLTFWNANGPGGGPGALLDFVSATATNVPLAGTFLTFDLSTLQPPVVLPVDTAYVGVGWDDAVDGGFLACADHDGTSVQPGFFDVDLQEQWQDLRGPDPAYTALMIRGLFADAAPSGPCMANNTTMCLNNSRFQVKVN